jgi:hypothetical protein
MDVSETIVAAGIGGAATVTAALFQLYTALRVKTKADSRPKKQNLLKSAVAIAALMGASAAGGYLFAEFREGRSLEDARAMHNELRGMRDELNAKLQALAERTERAAQQREPGETPADIETALLTDGAVDRACYASGGDLAGACGAQADAAPPTPAVTQAAGL